MSLFKDKIIGVLMGGLSKEREVSLRSGNAVLEALLQRGYDAVPIDVAADVAEVLKAKGIKHECLVTEGNPSWPVRRRYLGDFLALLLTGK